MFRVLVELNDVSSDVQEALAEVTQLGDMIVVLATYYAEMGVIEPNDVTDQKALIDFEVIEFREVVEVPDDYVVILAGTQDLGVLSVVLQHQNFSFVSTELV